MNLRAIVASILPFATGCTTHANCVTNRPRYTAVDARDRRGFLQ